MNIFNYEGKEFDKKLDEIFKDINKEKLREHMRKVGKSKRGLEVRWRK